MDTETVRSLNMYLKDMCQPLPEGFWEQFSVGYCSQCSGPHALVNGVCGDCRKENLNPEREEIHGQPLPTEVGSM